MALVRIIIEENHREKNSVQFKMRLCIKLPILQRRVLGVIQIQTSRSVVLWISDPRIINMSKKDILPLR